MFCPNCGTTLPDDSVFCSNCGANISAPSNGAAASQQAPAQQPSAPQPQVQYQTIVKQVIIQPKAKIGMDIGLLAALAAFIGIFSITGVVILAAYVFLKEEDLWLRKAVVKVLAVVAIFGLFSGMINVFFDVFRMINSTIALFDYPVQVLNTISSVETILAYIIDGIEAIFLAVLGFKALSMQTIRIPFVDKLLDKHMA